MQDERIEGFEITCLRVVNEGLFVHGNYFITPNVEPISTQRLLYLTLFARLKFHSKSNPNHLRYARGVTDGKPAVG
jgi:hypothetical protein